MRKRKTATTEQMRYKKHFQYYLIAMAVFFSCLNLIGVYELEEDESDFMQDTDCYIYSYYMKTDRHKIEQYTYDYDSIDEKLYEIFQQKVPCEDYVKFGLNWHVLLLPLLAFAWAKYIDEKHQRDKRFKQYEDEV